MILFLFGFSLCLNIILLVICFYLYKKFIPVFRSSTSVDLDTISDFWGDSNV